MIFEKITFKLIYIVCLLDFTKWMILPNLRLIVLVLILMVADLITGVLRAKLTKDPITSEKARRTIVKFLQYFGCIGMVIVLMNLQQDNERFVIVMKWAKDGLSILIIYIEALSVFENLYSMDRKTTFAKYFITPIYRLLSLAVRNNPLTKMYEDEKQIKKSDEN